MTDVRCPSCSRAVRVTSPTPQQEAYEVGRIKRKMGEACPRARSENRLPCPMAGGIEKETPELERTP